MLSNPPLVEFPPGCIAIWTGTIAGIPIGWKICDGTLSTPDLTAVFIEGVATGATNPGATGGAVNHAHALATGGSGNWIGDGSSGGTANLSVAADGRPPFYDVAFIMKI